MQYALLILAVLFAGCGGGARSGRTRGCHFLARVCGQVVEIARRERAATQSLARITLPR